MSRPTRANLERRRTVIDFVLGYCNRRKRPRGLQWSAAQRGLARLV